MLEYSAFNKQVYDLVPHSANAILDIGCGVGTLGKVLVKQRIDAEITGITYSFEEKQVAESYYKQVILHDLNDLSLQLEASFDVIIFSHVLEHTMKPAEVLMHYLRHLKADGIVIVALPNILFYQQRWQFVTGRFRYNPKGGLMDSTHLRFFDYYSAKKLLTDAGLTIVHSAGHGGFPQPVLRRLFPRLSGIVDRFASRILPGLFARQFVVVGRSLS